MYGMNFDDKEQAEKRRAHQVGMLSIYLALTLLAIAAIVWVHIVRFVIDVITGLL